MRFGFVLGAGLQRRLAASSVGAVQSTVPSLLPCQPALRIGYWLSLAPDWRGLR
jgi:hypothetical protein